jgi:hypothetical protein
MRLWRKSMFFENHSFPGRPPNRLKAVVPVRENDKNGLVFFNRKDI